MGHSGKEKFLWLKFRKMANGLDRNNEEEDKYENEEDDEKEGEDEEEEEEGMKKDGCLVGLLVRVG